MIRPVQRCIPSLQIASRSCRLPIHRPQTLLSPSRIASSPQVISQPRFFARTISQTTIRRDAVAQEEYADEGVAQGKPTKFTELQERGLVDPAIVSMLTGRMGMSTMTDVQSLTLEPLLKGMDLVAQAKTGTGKTLAFLLPIIQKIVTENPQLATRSRHIADIRDTRALIISPTRELAEQIASECRRITANTSIITQVAVGGNSRRDDLSRMHRQGCHILVGTPGRLKDVLEDRYSGVECPKLDALVLDEADRLLDQGFWTEIQRIGQLLPDVQEKNRQTLMFSATIPREVIDLVRSTLKPDFEFIQTVPEHDDPTHKKVKQNAIYLRGLENQIPALLELCKRETAKCREQGGRPFKAIIYFNSTAEVTLAASIFRATGSPTQRPALHPARAFEIHSRLTQNGRTRAADGFRNSQSAVLFSTDVTARGMDFPEVTHVIQVGIPTSRDQYIHRVGRTGRAGKEGEAYVLISKAEEQEGHKRLRGFPIHANDTLQTAQIDMSREADVPVDVANILTTLGNAMKNVDPAEFEGTYKALLGTLQYMSSRQTQIDAMNDLTRYGWQMPEPPALSPRLAQRLGFGRVSGLNSRSQVDSFHHELDSRDQSDRYGGRGSPFGRSGGRSNTFDRYNDRSDSFGGRSYGRSDSYGRSSSSGNSNSRGSYGDSGRSSGGSYGYNRDRSGFR